MWYELNLSKNAAGESDVAAGIDVNHDLRPLAILLTGIDAVDARLNVVGKLIPVLRQFSIGPHHAVADFVADLNDVRQNIRPGHRGDRVACIWSVTP